jgi:hypothetical protein
MESFQYQKHSLRIPVSEIAACVGFHPYRDLVQLAIRHVYQGSAGQELLRHDAMLLGLELESEEKLLMDIAQQAGTSTQQALKSALQVQSGEKRLASIEQVKKLCETVVQKAKESKKLSESQMKQLQQGSRHSIYTGFGTCWESQALDMYGKQYGCDVRARNEEIKIWHFAKSEDKTVQPMGLAYSYKRIAALDDSASREAKRQKQATSEIIDISAGASSESAAEQHPLQSKVQVDPCFFSLRGAIDGIRDELVPNISDSDDDSWIFRQIIVECKHRMNRLQPSPHLYEMIQTIAYCHMYQVKEADLVQVLRRRPKTKQSKQSKQPQHQTIQKFFTKKETKFTDPSNITNTTSKNDAKVVDLTNDADTNDKSNKPTNGKVEDDAKNDSKGRMTDLGAESNPEPATSDKIEQAEKGTVSSSVPEPSDSITTIDRNPFSGQQNKENMEQGQPVAAIMSSSSQRANGTETDSDINEHHSKANSSTDMEISVNRISLEDPLYHHGSYWNSTILPRLRSWVDGVYSIRSCDGKRYRLLMSSSTTSAKGDATTNNEDDKDNSLLHERKQEREAWDILFEECPWLLECDTRYNRELR